MTVRISRIPKDPYLGYNPSLVARAASACLQCQPAAPCTLACPNQAAIPSVMRVAGHAACEGLSITRWFQSREYVETARISDAISDSYN